MAKKPSVKGPDFTHWTLDKRLPIAVLVALLAQLGGGLIIWGEQKQIIAEHNRRIVTLESFKEKSETSAQQLAERLARIEERMTVQIELLRSIQQSLSPAKAPAQ